MILEALLTLNSQKSSLFIYLSIYEREKGLLSHRFAGGKNGVVVRQFTQSLGVLLVNSVFV